MSDKKVVIALGYFDGVHKGHKVVLDTALKKADETSALSVAFTFGGNLRGKLFGGKCIFTSNERAEILLEMGFSEIYTAPVTDEFLALSPLEFLDFINKKYAITHYVCGEDYRFGKGGAGDVFLLRKYAGEKGQSVIVCQDVYEKCEKVSSTLIKSALKSGDISRANELLGRDYFITGTVVADRGVGRLLGFPTVNFKVDNEKSELKNGVYAGYSVIDGVEHKAVINYGGRPTFNLSEKLVEAHLIGFSGSLYGKNVRVCFTRLLRDIKKFDGEEELKKQLKNDVYDALNGGNI